MNTDRDYGYESEEDLIQELEVFDQAVIWSTDWTSETVNNQLRRGNIDVNPKFQRRDAWSKRQKSRFIESLILGLPIPQIILAERKNKKGHYVVLDGKQRLLTLRQFYSRGKETGFTPLRLQGLEILSQLNGKTLQDILNDIVYQQIADQLMNHTIRTIVIKNWPNEAFLYTVFLRLNTGSIRLSPQELRQALHPGEFIDFVDSFAISSNPIKAMLKIDQPDFRMRDNEMVIRYFMFKLFLTDYTGNLKISFDRTVETLNAEWEQKKDDIENLANELNSSIQFVIEVFGVRNGFSKWLPEGRFQNNFNRAIFDVMIYYFSVPGIRNRLDNRGNDIIDAFKEICINDQEFLNAIEQTTKSTTNTAIRLNRWGEVVARLVNDKIEVPMYNEGRIVIVQSQNG
ncbi:DUF262 domain-containing protein [Lewinella sp. W8]|uniref:DUF262 domain-containing protein n=1 Tax=Lewinella sp. W8 TaxID=2528208 RepID=UPI0010681DD7|nr:DUF262 domain-containing protein [Lewinella sp. W8]MTB49798.1 DUF262 domain-containing protein [Lewinella sp. W8]